MLCESEGDDEDDEDNDDSDDKVAFRPDICFGDLSESLVESEIFSIFLVSCNATPKSKASLRSSNPIPTRPGTPPGTPPSPSGLLVCRPPAPLLQ